VSRRLRFDEFEKKVALHNNNNVINLEFRETADSLFPKKNLVCYNFQMPYSTDTNFEMLGPQICVNIREKFGIEESKCDVAIIKVCYKLL
jgi:hypothetical protein